MDSAFLVLETSSPSSSMALFADGRVIGEWTWLADRNHSRYVFGYLHEAVAMLGTRELDAVVVGSGPGSYAGVRVALAVADAVCLAYDARIACLCSWLGIKKTAGTRTVVLSDARRNGWAVAEVKDIGIGSHDIKICSREELISMHLAPEWEGVAWISPEASEVLKDREMSFVTPDCVPCARVLGSAWLHLSEPERERIAGLSPMPLYVRPPHITKAKLPPWVTKAGAKS